MNGRTPFGPDSEAQGILGLCAPVRATNDRMASHHRSVSVAAGDASSGSEGQLWAIAHISNRPCMSGVVQAEIKSNGFHVRH
jgi:hypothetical protein